MRIILYGHDNLATERLDRIVSELGHEMMVCQSTFDDTIATIKTQHPEILIVSATLVELDALCAVIKQCLPHPPALIIVGKEEKGALHAFELGACNYLLSPVSKEDIAVALCRVTQLNAAQALSLTQKSGNQKRTRQYIAARTHRGVEMVSMSDVYYFAADQKYVKVRHKDGVVLIDETLKDLEEEFKGVMFRIHRGALVNLEYLDLLELMEGGQYRVRFRGIDESLAVSRRHLPALRDKIHHI